MLPNPSTAVTTLEGEKKCMRKITDRNRVIRDIDVATTAEVIIFFSNKKALCNSVAKHIYVLCLFRELAEPVMPFPSQTAFSFSGIQQ